MMRTPAADALARSSRAGPAGSRLSVRAFAPHEPGCSRRSQRATTEAVAKRGSSRASEASEQRKGLLVNDYLEQPLSHEPFREDDSAGWVQIPV